MKANRIHYTRVKEYVDGMEIPVDELVDPYLSFYLDLELYLERNRLIIFDPLDPKGRKLTC